MEREAAIQVIQTSLANIRARIIEQVLLLLCSALLLQDSTEDTFKARAHVLQEKLKAIEELLGQCETQKAALKVYLVKVTFSILTH